MNLGTVGIEPLPNELEHHFTASQLDSLLPRTMWIILARSTPRTVMRSTCKAVAFAIHTYVMGSDTAMCWPSQATLALNTGLSEKAVWKAMRDLEADGWIERERPTRREAELIWLTWPSPESRPWCGTESRTPFRTQEVSPVPRAPLSPVDERPSPVNEAPSPVPGTDEGVQEGVLKVEAHKALDASAERALASARQNLAATGLKNAKKGAA